MFPAFQNILWTSILLGGLFSFIFGMMWYGPLFGKTWMKLTNMKKGEAKMEKPVLTMSLAALGNLLPAFALERLLAWSGPLNFHAALGIAFIVFVGFSATNMLSGVLWEGKSWKLFWFNASYTLITYLVMATIIFLLATD